MTTTLYHGDCLEIMQTMSDNSIDSIITDPPYGLSFMNKDWDCGVPGIAFWTEALRVAKPGAHLLAFGGTRTFHRLAVAIEDAGWEIRDTVMWVYGSGFPKSHQHLKPAWEPIIVARKPLEGTVAENVLTWGTGAINIGGSRVKTEESTERPVGKAVTFIGGWSNKHSGTPAGVGRWPANLIHDGSDEVLGLLNDAARFFYCAKASKRDRDEGCEGLEEVKSGMSNGAQIHGEGYDKGQGIGLNRVIKRKNTHPTVKPTSLMQYLCRLVTPPKGIILDPFMGSGSTGKSATLEGFNFVGIEIDEEYLKIARARIDWAEKQVEESQLKLFDKNVQENV